MELKKQISCKKILDFFSIINLKKCPFHDDTKNSFSLFITAEGYEMYKCHANCEKSGGTGDSIKLYSLLKGISYKEAFKEMLEKFENTKITPKNHRDYIYYNKVKPTEIIGKYKKALNDKSKNFHCRIATKEELASGFSAFDSKRKVFDINPKKTQGFVCGNLDLYKIAPFGIDKIHRIESNEYFFICEGEKDTENIINKLDYKATNGFSGSSFPLRPEDIELLKKNKTEKIVLVIDYDYAGIKYAQENFKLLKANGFSNIYFLDMGFPFQLKKGKDISDFLINKKISSSNKNEKLDNLIFKINKNYFSTLWDKFNFDINNKKDDYFPYNDYGNSLRYEYHYNSNIKYCPKKNKWFFFNEVKWEEDNLNKRKNYFKDFLKKIKNNPYEKYQKNIKWVDYCQKLSGERAIFQFLKERDKIKFLSEDFNNKEFLINCNGNSISLEGNTLDILTNNREDFCSQNILVKYNKKAKQPENWLKALNQYFDSDEDKIKAFQIFIGYSILGITTEKKLLIMQGESDTGKSTLLNVIGKIFHDYFIKIDPKIFLYGSEDKKNEVEADIYEKRLVRISEFPRQNIVLNEGKIKDYTGNIEKYQSRQIYKNNEYLKFVSSFIFDTNFLPKINDEAVWGRIIFLKFNKKIDKEKINPNFQKEYLEKELEGIFNWVIQGTTEYLFKYKKLFIPEICQKDLKDWKNLTNPLHEFIQQVIFAKEGNKIDSDQLYQAFEKYYKGQKNLFSKRAFILKFNKFGYKQVKSVGKRYYINIGIDMSSL